MSFSDLNIVNVRHFILTRFQWLTLGFKIRGHLLSQEFLCISEDNLRLTQIVTYDEGISQALR